MMQRIAAEMRIVALDLETTGLSSTTDRIVELAAVCWQDGRETATFQALVHPGCPIPPAAIAIHGITDAMVRDKPPVSAELPAFIAFCQADIIVAHNAQFDLGFLHAECARAGMQFQHRRVVDTCHLARRRLPGLTSYKLETLRDMLRLGDGRAHRALQDARDCLGLYLHCQQVPPAPPLPAALATLQSEQAGLVRQALSTGGTLMIEYQDGRGRTTRREIRPTHLDEELLIVEAHCLLRNNLRHFNIDRIRKAWLP